MTRPVTRPDRRDQDGFVAGSEALILGVVVFLVGTIVAINAWAVLDAKMSATAAAREGARAAVDGPAGAAGDGLVGIVDGAARAALEGQGKDPAGLLGGPRVSGAVARCAPITVEIDYRVTGIRAPWIGTFGSGAIDVTGRHTEVVDPFRSGLDGEADSCAF